MTRDNRGRFTKNVGEPVHDTYGFTTQEDDYYFPRVMDEAKEEANFLLVTQTNVRTGTKNLVLLVRKAVLNIAERFPKLILCGKSLEDWLDMALNQEDDWSIAVVSGQPSEIDKSYNTVREEIKRINNAIAGRNVKVTVTAF
jgi:hypothetical protein